MRSIRWSAIKYMTDAEVEDGKNVHDVYRIVKDLASIFMIHYTVNIL